MATKAQIKEDRKVKIVAFLKKSGPVLPKVVVDHLKAPIDEVKVCVDELIDEGKIRSNAENKKLLEVVPAKKKAAPAPAAKSKAKAKPAPVEEDEDEDEEEEDEDEEEVDPDEEDDDWGEEEDEEEADEEEVEEEDEDPDEDDPEEEDETDDDEDDDPAPPKGKAGKKAAPAAAPHKVFTMPFKPIDTLTDKELTKRIDDGVEAAESAHEDGFVEVAEMLMRSVARARKQLNKRK